LRSSDGGAAGPQPASITKYTQGSPNFDQKRKNIARLLAQHDSDSAREGGAMLPYAMQLGFNPNLI
jgi:hypothetical protein